MSSKQKCKQKQKQKPSKKMRILDDDDTNLIASTSFSSSTRYVIHDDEDDTSLLSESLSSSFKTVANTKFTGLSDEEDISDEDEEDVEECFKKSKKHKQSSLLSSNNSSTSLSSSSESRSSQASDDLDAFSSSASSSSFIADELECAFTGGKIGSGLAALNAAIPPGDEFSITDITVTKPYSQDHMLSSGWPVQCLDIPFGNTNDGVHCLSVGLIKALLEKRFGKDGFSFHLVSSNGLLFDKEEKSCKNEKLVDVVYLVQGIPH
jgi:hypothetical protein